MVAKSHSQRLKQHADTLSLKAIRPARENDLCILLCSTEEKENLSLHRLQATLQAILGGRIVAPVHLTCHRFECPESSSFSLLLRNVTDALTNIQPFPITAVSFVPLYSSFREVNLLKWRIQVSLELRLFTSLVEGVLVATDIHSIYPPGWTSSLVTALEDIPELCFDRQELNNNPQLARLPFPQHLFTARQITISRVKGPDSFDILEQIPIP